MEENATPFFSACENGREDILRVLLADPRTDVTLLTHSGASPFFVVCQNGHNHVIDLLLEDQRVCFLSSELEPESLCLLPVLYLRCRHLHTPTKHINLCPFWESSELK